MGDKTTDWNLKHKAERDAIKKDPSKLRELIRDYNGQIFFKGKPVEVFPLSPPEFVSSRGYATMYFDGEDDIKRGVYVEIEKRCSKLNADCYEVGRNLVTWSSDPGYGSKTENYTVQFYRIDNSKDGLIKKIEDLQSMLHRVERSNSEQRIAWSQGFTHY